MDKQLLLKNLLSTLRLQAESALAASQNAHAEATHEESKPENEYDTRGLEAGYLAEAQAARAAEISRSIRVLEEFRLPLFAKKDPVALGALIEAECLGKKAHYFFLPAGAGVPLSLEGKGVMVLTPASRLGQEFQGKRVGDSLELESKSQVREYTIISIS
jgi:hypothetical protein